MDIGARETIPLSHHRWYLRLRQLRAHKALVLATVWNLLASIVIAPLTANAFDFATIIGPVERWLHGYGSPLTFTKFGLPYDAWVVSTVALATHVSLLHLSPVAELIVIFKAPLIAANIATAFAIRRLAHLRSWPHPDIAAIVWLTNPISLWVAAGHGQVEPLAILATAASLLAYESKRPFVAGLISGLGIGIEYFVVLVCLRVIGNDTIGTRPTRSSGLATFGLPPVRKLLSFGVGMLAGLVIAYGPVLALPLGRSAVMSGLAIGESSTLHNSAIIKPRSIWYLAALTHHASISVIWPLVFLLGCMLLYFPIGRMLAKRSHDWPYLIFSFGLMWFVISYPVSLPQFTAITEFGAVLLVALGLISAAWALLGPLIAYVGFFFGTSFYWYLIDIQPNVWIYVLGHQLLPVLPVNRSGIPYLLLSYSLVAFTVLLIAISIQLVLKGNSYRFRREHEHRSKWLTFAARVGPIVLAVVPIFLVMAISLQGPFRSQVFSSKRRQLVGISTYINPLLGPVVKRADGEVRPSENSAVWASFMEGRTTPKVGLSVLSAPYVVQNYVTAPLREGLITLPHWRQRSSSTIVLWLDLLVHVPGMERWHVPKPVSVNFDGHALTSVSGIWSNPGWVSYWFILPAHDVGRGGQVSVQAGRDMTIDGNPGNGKVFAIVTPREEWMRIGIGNRVITRLFVGQIDGWGIISGIWSSNQPQSSLDWARIANHTVEDIGQAAYVWGDRALWRLSPEVSGFLYRH